MKRHLITLKGMHTLWFKLYHEGISTKKGHAIKKNYETEKMCARHKSTKSEWTNSQTGVKQGNPLSSLMFTFFINDIANNINCNIDTVFTVDDITIFMLLYADDAVLFARWGSTGDDR